MYVLSGAAIVSADCSVPYYKHIGLHGYLFQAPNNGSWMLTDHKDKIKESRGFIFTAQTQLSDPTGKAKLTSPSCIRTPHLNTNARAHLLEHTLTCNVDLSVVWQRWDGHRYIQVRKSK